MMVVYQQICQWFQNIIFFEGKLYSAQCVGIKLSFNESPILNYLMKCNTLMDSFWDLFRFTLTQISHWPSDQDDMCKKLHANKCFTSSSPKPAYSKFKSMYYKTIIRKHLHISFCWLSVEYYFEKLIQLFFCHTSKSPLLPNGWKREFSFFFFNEQAVDLVSCVIFYFGNYYCMHNFLHASPLPNRGQLRAVEGDLQYVNYW